MSGGVTATFVYDGDGNRVQGTVGSTTTTYIGTFFEWTGSTSTMVKYYHAGSTRLAMRQGASTLYFLLGDHLGSTSITANSSGVKTAELRYKAWGENRFASGSTPTTHRFTGQQQESSLGGADGLYYYGARWYDPSLGRFAQADTLIPDPGNPHSWDRYAYALNNAVKYTDPTGHKVDQGGGVGGASMGDDWWKDRQTTTKPEALGNNVLDSVPVVTNARGIIRGVQTSMWASQQVGFSEQQTALQTWYNSCYGLCHYADHVAPGQPNIPIGGPMPSTPLVDIYSSGMGEAAGNAVSLLIDAAYAKATTNIFAYGGKEWHVGWQTNDEWSIIHLGNAANPKWGGIHLAIGSVGPRQSFFHVYVYPNPHIFINWPK